MFSSLSGECELLHHGGDSQQGGLLQSLGGLLQSMGGLLPSQGGLLPPRGGLLQSLPPALDLVTGRPYGGLPGSLNKFLMLILQV
jgi:hypothetical protein